MRRRSLLRSIAAIAASTGLVGAGKASGLSRELVVTPAGEKPRAKQFIEAADGTNLFFRDWGTGRPLVFAAPWGLNSAWWEYQMADLAGRGLRCVGYDRRGHGRSGEPSHGYEFDTLADDLAAVIEQLDLRDITLVGQSLGCGEVVRYLSRHGSNRVARIVLVATITPFVLKTDDNPEGVDRASLEIVRKVLSKDRAHPIAAAAPAFFGAPKNRVSQEIMDWWVRMMIDECSLKTMLDLQRMFTGTDFRPELRRISVPTLLIHGDNDTSTPIETTARKTAPLIPGCQLKVYEGAAHGLPITHADQLNADLLAFTKS
jgi:pimeloyl-ACP methyl ester carboxylesterase